MGRLNSYLRTIHGHGYWIEAWYPHSSGGFECRISAGAGVLTAWAVHPDALEALADAMRKAGLPVEAIGEYS